MSELSTNIKITEEKLKYIFEITFKSKINLDLFELTPDFYNNNFDSYEIQLEFDFLEEIDPDSSYLFEKVNKIMNEVSNFFKEYTVNLNGKIEISLPHIIKPPILFGLDYLYGDKLIIKMILGVYFE